MTTSHGPCVSDSLCEELQGDHFLYWGKLYKAGEVDISWHGKFLTCFILYLSSIDAVPGDEEVHFALEILTKIGGKSLSLLESLLASVQSWDSVAKNDFCR